jgi:hypothetical protein
MTVQTFLELNEASIGPSGAAWDSCDALKQLNKARSALYGLEDFDGLIQPICMNSCATLHMPWFGQMVKSAYRCNQIIPIAPGEYWAAVPAYCCGPSVGITDLQTYSPVPVANTFYSRIGVRGLSAEDIGTKVKISYYTHAGSIQTDELELISSGVSVTEMSVASIISIKKGPTDGRVAFHVVDSNGECCGNPMFYAYALEDDLKYRQYCMSLSCCSSCRQVIIKVKKKYLPFTDKHYNHQIDFEEHPLAIAMQAMAELSKRTQEGYKMYQVLIASAINYLKKNTSKAQETIGDMTLSTDYPAVVDECLT